MPSRYGVTIGVSAVHAALGWDGFTLLDRTIRYKAWREFGFADVVYVLRDSYESWGVHYLSFRVWPKPAESAVQASRLERARTHPDGLLCAPAPAQRQRGTV